jgi:ABC-type amino acid transport substrate-binding protein
MDSMRDEDCHRFATVINRDKVLVPTNVSLNTKPKWDVYENNHFAMRKRLVGIFLRIANKVITRIRAGKRLKQIKNKFLAEKIFTKEDAKKWVLDDCKAA